MYIRLAFIIACFFILSDNLKAQVDPDASGYFTDALRFSQTTRGGTARFLGMGGVNTALGADLSSLSGNPAGLGFYQKSEAALSLGFGFANTSSAFGTKLKSDNRDYFYAPNLGFVLTKRKDETETDPFRGGSFGIGLTRINNFQNQFSYSGINNTSSLTDFFLDQTKGIDPADLDAESGNITTLQGLAYWTFLTNPPDAQHPDYWTFNQGYSSVQEETVLTRGAMNQWNFSYGANFNDKIYIGASLGLPQLRYIAEKSYKETVINNDTLDNFRFNESLKVKGGGVNFKVGLIAKPEDWLRVGVTLQSPTFYSINEEYVYQIKAIYKNVATSTGYVLDQEEKRTNPGVYRYNLTTPFRASAGLAIFAGKAGFVSADIEYVPYNRAKLKESQSYLTFNNSTFEGYNNTIKNIYRSTYNINVGGEFRLLKIYRLRAGYALMNDPYNDIDDVDRKTLSISGGAGVRLDKYYLDIALVNTKFNSLYKPYPLANGLEPEIATKNKNTSFILTTGVIF